MRNKHWRRVQGNLKAKRKAWLKPHFTLFWNEGLGRWAKRRLSKMRRRAWKDSHERGLSKWESEVNWKLW